MSNSSVFAFNIATLTGTFYSSAQIGFADNGIAVDHQGNIWLANTASYNVIELNGSTGAVLSPSGGITGGGLSSSSRPMGIAIDGAGNVWTANDGNLSEFNGVTGAAISPSSGIVTYSSAAFYPTVAIDGSGNVWAPIEFFNDNYTDYGNLVVEYVGAAAPVVTPLAAGVKNNSLGTRP